MDIGSKKGYPSSALSNFAPHPFVFDGIECSSMEGLLQAFKFKNADMQVEVCKLVGLNVVRASHLIGQSGCFNGLSLANQLPYIIDNMGGQNHGGVHRQPADEFAHMLGLLWI